MATRSEEARAAQERKNSRTSPNAKKRTLKKTLAARHKEPELNKEAKHADRKATYVLEDRTQGARPSRKSTRKASNRMKETATLDIREELRGNAPSQRAARAGVAKGRARVAKKGARSAKRDSRERRAA